MFRQIYFLGLRVLLRPDFLDRCDVLWDEPESLAGGAHWANAAAAAARCLFILFHFFLFSLSSLELTQADAPVQCLTPPRNT